MQNAFNALKSNSRFYILLTSFIFSYVIYGNLQTNQLEQTYALISLLFLYFTLLAGPFCYTFKNFPLREEFLHARRALGVSAFYFALLHASITFFGSLGGFSGFWFLDENDMLAIILGFIGLFILFLLAITSMDWIIKKMTFKKWKMLHRFVYLGAVAILLHTFIIGANFDNLSALIPQIAFFALSFLFILEAPRLQKIFIKTPQFGLPTVLVIIILCAIYFSFFFPFSHLSNQPSVFDIHAAHKALAEQAQQKQLSSIAAFQGDSTLRYSVSFIKPDTIEPDTDTTLHFKITDATNGNDVILYRIFYEKPMHMIVVNNKLNYFVHLHPTQIGNDFSLTTNFPTNDIYHIYLSYQPWNAIEQQVAFSLPVGDSALPTNKATQTVDKKLTKKFGDVLVTLDTHGELVADEMSLGQQIISFTLHDAQTKKPLTNLKPYLGAFGHLTMINQKDYAYLHVHPANIITPKPDQTSGPTVDFLPIGIYGKFKAGTYRVFAEFNPDGKLFTADFTIKIN